MTKTPIITLAVLAAISAQSTFAADCTVTEKLTILSPQMKEMYESMSPSQQGHLRKSRMGFLSGIPIKGILYVSGKKLRSDIAGVTTVYDSGTNKLVTINRTNQTYSVRSLAGTQSPISAAVTSLGPGVRILGHATRHYRFSTNMRNAQFRGLAMSGEIWSAQDLPSNRLALSMLGGGVQAPTQLEKIKGQVLKVTAQITGTPIGSISVNSYPVSVSTARIPVTIFAVPKGYRQTAPSRNVGPLGG